MRKFYIHTIKDSDGDYEVHKDGCKWLPDEEELKYLGLYNTCRDAVHEAEKTYDPVNGCNQCCQVCYTRR